jgi:hypothetical protein
MSKLSLFSSITLLLVITLSCNKIERFEKKLSGTWNIKTLEFTNPNGLSYFYPAKGSISYIDSETPGQGTYTSNYYYIIGEDTVYVNENGSYGFNYEGTEFYDIIRENGAESDTLKKARVLVITTSDLRTEMTEVHGRKSFVLTKVD